MAKSPRKKLRLTLQGRIIDHLGIEMYQSPVAALGELVSNAWDADAEEVHITLPERINQDAEIVIRDNGFGMTFQECEKRYLNVGYCRRGDDPDERSLQKHRRILGRKGIGKFAGFGIAKKVQVETISERTGEKTVFELDIDLLRTDQYVTRGKRISVISYLGPNPPRRTEHGTVITLKSLTIGRLVPATHFGRSMARRFLLHQVAADFNVKVNGAPIPKSEDLAGVEFTFPRDYRDDERPERLRTDGDGWGVERLGGKRQIKWKVWFFKEPIEDEELKGVAVFAKEKLAQRPFFFNLTGGLGGQHGQEYLSGQVRADYIDLLGKDIIAPERQRINWEHADAIVLEKWGRDRIKHLLRLWRDRRGEKRRQQIERKLAGFTGRLEKLPPHERRTVKSALTKLGGVPTLSDAQFEELAGAVLQAWEQGRLRGLIDEISQQEQLTADTLLGLLAEADVLIALQLAETVKTKLEAIRGLRELVGKGGLENKIRDYIAEKPYILDAKWETFKKEVSVNKILADAAKAVGLSDKADKYGRKRIDLALRSGEHLLVVEFMQPGKTADYDHVSRCKAYLHRVRHHVATETALGITHVTGLLVADNLDRKPEVEEEIKDMRQNDIWAYSWTSLLEEAERRWRDFLDTVGERSPGDDRMRSLRGKNG